MCFFAIHPPTLETTIHFIPHVTAKPDIGFSRNPLDATNSKLAQHRRASKSVQLSPNTE
jgi:hypothetical protein